MDSTLTEKLRSMPTLGVTALQDAAHPQSALATGLSLIAAERDGISHLHQVYSTDPVAQEAFEAAVDTLVQTRRAHGHVVVSGVGKSGLIGRKMAATLNSLGIRSSWLHPTEALHGDLGMIGPHDALVLLTFSGSTAELLSMACHLPAASPLILLSAAQPDAGLPLSSMPLFAARAAADTDAQPGRNVLLPTPVPVSEAALLGIAAPTISTTVVLALADALALAAADRLHHDRDGVREAFRVHHPGGAIGRAHARDAQVALSLSRSSSSETDASGSSLEGSTVADDIEEASPQPQPELAAVDAIACRNEGKMLAENTKPKALEAKALFPVPTLNVAKPVAA